LKRTILLYLFLLIAGTIFSQEKIVLKGKIEVDSIVDLRINIVNLTQKTGTTNFSDGLFEIKVKENDTLIFSSIQFENREIIITKEILEDGYLNVKLVPNINELGEVPLSNTYLTGNLTRDLANIEVFNKAEAGFPWKDYKEKSEMDKIYSSLSGSPISLLINTFNGKLKRFEEANKLIKFDNNVDRGIKAVPTSFFTVELSIPEEDIISFVYYCARNENFQDLVIQEHPLDLMDFYYTQAPVFLKKLSPQPVSYTHLTLPTTPYV